MYPLPVLPAVRLALSLLRELGTLRRELERLRVILQVLGVSGDNELGGQSAHIEHQSDSGAREIVRISGLLSSDGYFDLEERA